MNAGVVILAAGGSSRMGRPKQLLPCHGTTLLEHTVATALSLGGAPVVVVLGANAEPIRGQLDEGNVFVVENADWHEGMGGSLRTGLHALLAAHPETEAVIFVPCDQPLLTAEILRALVATHERTGKPIVASEYDGVMGVPAFFTAENFPELLALDGAFGARQIIRAHRALAVGVPFPGGATDLDTPADYARFQEFSREPSAPAIV